MNSVEASRVLKVRLQSVINRRKVNSHGSHLSGTPNLSEDTKLPEINVKANSVRVELKTILK